MMAFFIFYFFRDLKELPRKILVVEIQHGKKGSCQSMRPGQVEVVYRFDTCTFLDIQVCEGVHMCFDVTYVCLRVVFIYTVC